MRGLLIEVFDLLNIIYIIENLLFEFNLLKSNHSHRNIPGPSQLILQNHQENVQRL